MSFKDLVTKYYIWVSLTVVVIMAVILFLMGREPWCTCGYIKLWHGVVFSSENSQHIFDWYTFTHIVHGLLFYAGLSLFGKKLSFQTKLLAAIFLESSWEILENTDYVINRYREVTISLDYFGDSIINSIADVLAMTAGFLFAYKNKVWLGIALFLALEVGLMYFIRDNLTINIIMLIYPLDAIKIWQSAI